MKGDLPHRCSSRPPPPCLALTEDSASECPSPYSSVGHHTASLYLETLNMSLSI